jgi:hypothetical protein
MTCADATAYPLIMGHDPNVVKYAVTNADGSPANITGITVAAVASYDATSLIPAAAIVTANPGLISVTFTAGQLATIGVGKNVALSLKLWNPDNTLYQLVSHSLVTVA